MNFLSISVNAPSAEEAVAEIRKRAASFSVRQLVFFASYTYDFPLLGKLIHEAFPGALTLGCTSYAELGGGRIGRGTVSCLAFGPGALEAMAATAAADLSSDPLAVDKALKDLEAQLGGKLLELDYRRHFGLSLFDGRSPHIEKAMARVASLTDITFIGGYASDNFTLDAVAVCLNGKTYADCAILAVVRPGAGFSLLKTQSHEPVGPVYTATKVDEAGKLVFELDGRTARDVFAEGIGVAHGELTEDHFLTYSLGVMAEGEPFIRAGAKINPDGSLQFFCTVLEGQRLALMRVGDQVRQTRAALEREAEKLGGIGAVLDFDCAHRDINIQSSRKIDEYISLFSGMQAAGFATFGELFIANVNQTAVMALFK